MKYVTVKELKELLKNEDDDAIIVLSSDEEGNSFSPLHESYGVDNFLSDGNYGEIHPRELTPELIKQGYTEEDLGSKEDRKKMIKCITLYPLN